MKWSIVPESSWLTHVIVKVASSRWAARAFAMICCPADTALLLAVPPHPIMLVSIHSMHSPSNTSRRFWLSRCSDIFIMRMYFLMALLPLNRCHFVYVYCFAVHVSHLLHARRAGTIPSYQNRASPPVGYVR